MTDNPNLETGCYIGSWWGIYSIEHLYDLVAHFIRPNITPTDSLPADWESISLIIHHSLHGDQDETITIAEGENITLETAHDLVSELYDELTDLLPTDPGHGWMWHEGELFYYSDDEIDENGE